MKNILILLLVLINSLFGIDYTDVTYNKNETTIKMPDKNATKLELREYFQNTSKYNKTNFDSNESLTKEVNVDGSYRYVNNENNVSLSNLLKVSIPANCADPQSTSTTLTDMYISSYEVVTNRKTKRIALGLVPATNQLQRIINNNKIDQNKCIKIMKSNSTQEEYMCGPCTEYVKPLMVKKTSSGYVPDNKRLKNYYQFNGGDNKATALFQKMKNNNELSKRLDFNNPGTIDPTTVPQDLQNSRDANISKKSAEIVQSMFITQMREKITKCFVKRELVPQFYCPLPGLNFGAKTGGNPEDDIDKAKAQCDSFCVSSPYSCKALETGHNKIESISDAIVYDFKTTDYDDMQTKKIELLLNDDLELKHISYDLNIVMNSDVNLTQKYGIDVNLNNIPMYIRTRISYKISEDSMYVDFTGPSRFKIDSLTSTIQIPKIPRAEKIKIVFHKPTMKHRGSLLEVEIKDVFDEVRAENIKIEYSDDKYHFCSLQQLIIDPSTQCVGGESFEIASSGETFIVCKSDNRIQGPEPVLGGYYTEESCQASCVRKQECVETFSNYTDKLSSYKITVGCVDDPYNTNCSKARCEELFKTHEELPVEEKVYDSRNKTRITVSSGIQVQNESRPRIMLDEEYSAQLASDKSAAYASVFLEEMKDQAYQSMITRGTYNYSKKVISLATETEYAYRQVAPYSASDSEYTGDLSEGTFYWKLKPSSFEINNGKSYYVYKIAKIEQVFRPISGAFVEKYGKLTNFPTRSYKDEVYSFITDDENIPFYIQEYSEVYIDNNVSSGWVVNSQHAKNKYIVYDQINDIYIDSSKDELASEADFVQFDGLQNYEEFLFLNNPIIYFTKIKDGASIQSQKTINQGMIPTKHYSISSLEIGSNSGISDYHLFGVYSKIRLTKEEIITMIDGEDSDKYKIYRLSKGNNNKKEIYGDGKFKKNELKFFVKGSPSSTSLSVEMNPRIEEEGKDVIMFMFMFEGDI